MNKNIARAVVHAITDIRGYQYKQLAKFARDKTDLDILELGSGKPVNGKYPYSAKHLFDANNNFMLTDINKSFGHPVLDVTKMTYSNKFDIVLCLNVLEHVYDFETAINNIHKALKKGGVAIVAVPTFYPLHDEPGDYWRFTEHSLRKLFSGFKSMKLIHKGKREFPITYYLEVTK